MNILYGVQGTGNGHISRSREVVRELKERGHSVHVLISGREPDRLPSMEEFGDYDTRRGLTFVTEKGHIRQWKTARQLKLGRFYKDIRSYDAGEFDLVVTDFEPLTSRIAKRAKLPCIGIGHQYAFFYPIPTQGANPMTRWIVKHFAFCDIPVGLHWHHFELPILPPIIPNFNGTGNQIKENMILVYLIFEDQMDIMRLLEPFTDHQFYVYGMPEAEDRDHVHFRPFSRSGFLDDLRRCGGVICNAGFELPSETLQLGKKLLVRPVAGQMEQLSNARVIHDLGLGYSMTALDPAVVRRFLEQPQQSSQNYPDVAALLAEWIDDGFKKSVAELSRGAWKGVAIA